jgi:hypothetical protein
MKDVVDALLSFTLGFKMDSHFGKSMRTHRGSGPTPEDWSDLTRELE